MPRVTNAQKTPFVQTQNEFAVSKALETIRQTGRALPCSVMSVSGQIVTVSFQVQSSTFTLPNVTIPVATSRYDWLPIQKGDLGVTLPGDVYLGGVSGLGGGVADLTQRGNLTALVFVPCANKAWSVSDPNKRLVQGPNGVVLQDETGKCVFTLTQTGITVTLNGVTIWTLSNNEVSASVNLATTADVITGTIASVNGHEHSGVQSGSSNTGPPVSGT